VPNDQRPEPAGTLAALCAEAYRAALTRLSAARRVSEALAAEPLPAGPVRVLALGKAAAPMLDAAAAALGERLRDPLCVYPERTPGPRCPGALAVAAGHPRPTDGSLRAGEAIQGWAAAGGGAPALVLLSGGGSALAVAPAGVGLADKIAGAAAVMRAGLPIGALNTVRKHLSILKGGQLGAALFPAPTRVLVLSDVPGDDLSVIASGPLAPDPSTFGDALAAVDAAARAGIAAPPAVRARLEAGARGAVGETVKPGDPRLAGVAHRLLAGPLDLARAAAGRPPAAAAPPRPTRRRSRATSRRWPRGSPRGPASTPGGDGRCSPSAASPPSACPPTPPGPTAAAPSTWRSSARSRWRASPPRRSPPAPTGATGPPSRPARWWTARPPPPPAAPASTSPPRSPRPAPAPPPSRWASRSRASTPGRTSATW